MWCIQAFIYFPRYGATLSNASRRDLSPFCTRPPTMVRSDIAQLTPGRDALRHPRSDERCLCSLSLVPIGRSIHFFRSSLSRPTPPTPTPFQQNLLGSLGIAPPATIQLDLRGPDGRPPPTVAPPTPSAGGARGAAAASSTTTSDAGSLAEAGGESMPLYTNHATVAGEVRQGREGREGGTNTHATLRRAPLLSSPCSHSQPSLPLFPGQDRPSTRPPPGARRHQGPAHRPHRAGGGPGDQARLPEAW
jgi:hypothetical protein